jgi:hypothetical protein
VGVLTHLPSIARGLFALAAAMAEGMAHFVGHTS